MQGILHGANPGRPSLPTPRPITTFVCNRPETGHLALQATTCEAPLLAVTRSAKQAEKIICNRLI